MRQTPAVLDSTASIRKAVILAIPYCGITMRELAHRFPKVLKERKEEFKTIIQDVSKRIIEADPKLTRVVRKSGIAANELKWRENWENFPAHELPPANEWYNPDNMCWSESCERTDNHYCEGGYGPSVGRRKRRGGLATSSLAGNGD